ncbi:MULTISPECIES: cellulose-binding domain-containing protein [Streptomyces]|uniref:cellulose-binding domain-containing protein n=1 Tax=Streptomyces TaxID=1883 RepID=UPI001679AAAF|nr:MULTISPECIES: cellulose-binding domain-containing protein [Streptomyces]MBK3521896.1 cellulose-binding domain-containing protein [Streptomyces sp. MBT70]GGS10560.1 hydrolase [Streptomyces eurythermus]
MPLLPTQCPRWVRTPWTAAVAVLGLAVSLLVAAPASGVGAGAAAGCRVDYTVNEWSGGYTAQVRVTNLGPALSAWRLTWTYGGDQRITSAWNATVTQTGRSVTAVGTAWNAALPSGGAADFGVQGTWQSADPAPTDFSLNGVSCGGDATEPPTTPPTTPGTPSPTQPPADCGGAALCSDFENQAGTSPSGDWRFTAPDCQGTGTATIDTAVAHSGAKSLRVDGRAGYCNHAFVAATTDLSTVGPVLYVRMWVRHTTALPSSHVTFVSMPDSSQGGRALRVGGQNGALQWNRESDDATLPAQSPAGVALSKPLPTGSWQCLRFAIDTSAPKLDTWLGDQQVPGLHADGVPTQDIDQQWLSRTTPPRPTALRLGWESYGTGDDTLWFDDVAVGSAPIGC